MPNDDESNNDEQGSSGSVRKQDDEPKPPVYLFPEDSVYDLAPIVVPENMRLSPDEEDASEQSENNQEPETLEPGASEQDASEQVMPEHGTPEQGTPEQVLPEQVLPEQDAPEQELPEQSPPEQDTPEQVTPAQENLDQEKPEQIKPEQQKPEQDLRAKLNAQKVKATSEQALIAKASILKNRIDVSRTAKPRSDESTAGETQVEDKTESNGGTPLTPGQQAHRDSGNLFPENSVFELDPVTVINENQQLMPERKPTWDPTKANKNLSPIKIDKFKAGAQRQAAEARQAAEPAAKAPGKEASASENEPVADWLKTTTPEETVDFPNAAEHPVSVDIFANSFPSAIEEIDTAIAEPTSESFEEAPAEPNEQPATSEDENADADMAATGVDTLDTTIIIENTSEEPASASITVTEGEVPEANETIPPSHFEVEDTGSESAFIPKTAASLFGSSDDEDDGNFEHSFENGPTEAAEPETGEQNAAETDAGEPDAATVVVSEGETIADDTGTISGAEEPTFQWAPAPTQSSTVTGETEIPDPEAYITAEQEIQPEYGSPESQDELPHVQNSAEQVPDLQVPETQPEPQAHNQHDSVIEPFDITQIGVATSDIDQIILGRSDDQLTRSGDQQDSGAEPEAPHDSGEFDEEDVLQDFRPTDSIYELAPFVLPSEQRLTDDDKLEAPAEKTPPTVKQIVRHAETPERPAVPSYSTDPLVGTILAHSYEVLDVIGQGGMAIVYRAKQIATGRLVAIKTLRSQNPQDMMRFAQEIKTHSRLDHKNIVGFIDSFEARDQQFLVMERVRGISLQEIIRALGKLDEPENIVDILSQILDALEYAHAGGLIHRDLKTGNIILIKEVDNDMVVKILDFGIAKVQGDMQRLTHVGQALGSPIYMSPEQCSGKTLSTRSDLYSLGVLLYESVTGTPPYSKGTLINVMAAHCNENIKPKPLSEMTPNLPKYKILDQILQKALQTHPDKRWQSAAEFKLALNFWLKAVQMDLATDELPVELLRCPITEFDLDKLLVSAGAVLVKEPVPFQWASESAKQETPVQTEKWGEQPEEGAWSEVQEVVSGWGEGTTVQSDAAPGWGQAETPNPAPGNQTWGGSERHRQGQTGDAWNANPVTATGAQQVPSNFSVANTGSDTGSTTDSQADTSDLFSAEQKLQGQKPVRDLLASPVSPPNNNFEVQTSVEMNALGSQLPKLTTEEQSEIRSIANSGSLQKALNSPDGTRTVDNTIDAVPPSSPVDLRRRQAPVSPPSSGQQLLSIAIVVFVSVLLTFCLSAWYFVSNPDDVKAKWEAIQGLFNKDSNPAQQQTIKDEPVEQSNPEPSTSVNKDEVSEQSTGDAEDKRPSGSSTADELIESTDSSTRDQDTSTDNASDEKSEPSETDSSSSIRETSPTSEPNETVQQSVDTKSETTKSPEEPKPIPFKKGEPEEGIDF